jgi:hypothetical protein
MLWSFRDWADLVLGGPPWQAREALAHGRQLDLLVWLSRFCTEFLDGLLGQQQMGQAGHIGSPVAAIHEDVATDSPRLQHSLHRWTSTVKLDYLGQHVTPFTTPYTQRSRERRADDWELVVQDSKQRGQRIDQADLLRRTGKSTSASNSPWHA